MTKNTEQQPPAIMGVKTINCEIAAARAAGRKRGVFVGECFLLLDGTWTTGEEGSDAEGSGVARAVRAARKELEAGKSVPEQWPYSSLLTGWRNDL